MVWSYQPDLDERTPNILLSGSANVVPTTAGGFRNAYTAPVADSQSGQPSYPDTTAIVVGARYLQREDGTGRLFAGTATRIYEANQAVAYAWTDESRGANYSGVSQWQFDCYGDTMLAAASLGTRTEIQASTGAIGTNFANLTNAPKARIIVVQDNAVYAFDYDATGTGIPNGWIRSDTGGITTWTTGTGECVAGRFTESPGSITAAIKHGSGVVVFKARGMWRGQYVGLPEVVRWELVTENVGCCGPLAVVCVEDVLYFLDAQGFWRYDGSRPQRISVGNASAMRAFGGASVSSAVQIGIDDVGGILHLYSPTVGGDSSASYSYNYITGAWGPLVTSLHNGISTLKQVSAVCNGPYEKLHVMGGMPLDATKPNAYRFITGTGNQGLLRLFASSEYISESGSKLLSYSYTIIPGIFGQNKSGSQVTRVHHDLRSYSKAVTATGAVSATTDTLVAYRRPFSRGFQQASGTGAYTDSLGYTDVRANGNWFKDTFSQTITGAANNDSVTLSFEWLGFEPEYADNSRPKN